MRLEMSSQVRKLVKVLIAVEIRTSLGAFQGVLLGLQLGSYKAKAVHSSDHWQSILGQGKLYHVVLYVCYEGLIANLGGYAHYLSEQCRNFFQNGGLLLKFKLDKFIHPNVGFSEHFWSCHF